MLGVWVAPSPSPTRGAVLHFVKRLMTMPLYKVSPTLLTLVSLSSKGQLASSELVSVSLSRKRPRLLWVVVCFPFTQKVLLRVGVRFPFTQRPILLWVGVCFPFTQKTTTPPSWCPCTLNRRRPLCGHIDGGTPPSPCCCSCWRLASAVKTAWQALNVWQRRVCVCVCVCVCGWMCVCAYGV